MLHKNLLKTEYAVNHNLINIHTSLEPLSLSSAGCLHPPLWHIVLSIAVMLLPFVL